MDTETGVDGIIAHVTGGLHQELDAFEAEVTEFVGSRQTAAVEEEKRCETLMKAKAEASELEAALCDLQLAVGAADEEYHKGVKAAGMQSASLEHAMQELKESLTKFARLGLKFDTLPDSVLALTFVSVDPADHSREFTFSVRVADDTDLYQLMSCDPPIKGVEAHVARLNATTDFSRFVQAMRREFRAMVV